MASVRGANSEMCARLPAAPRPARLLQASVCSFGSGCARGAEFCSSFNSVRFNPRVVRWRAGDSGAARGAQGGGAPCLCGRSAGRPPRRSEGAPTPPPRWRLRRPAARARAPNRRRASALRLATPPLGGLAAGARGGGSALFLEVRPGSPEKNIPVNDAPTSDQYDGM